MEKNEQTPGPVEESSTVEVLTRYVEDLERSLAVMASRVEDLERSLAVMASRVEDLERSLAVMATTQEEARTPIPRFATGRSARVGDWVTFWRVGAKQADSGPRLDPTPAMVTGFGASGLVHLNLFELGAINFVLNVHPSDEPKAGCWSWREEVVG